MRAHIKGVRPPRNKSRAKRGRVLRLAAAVAIPAAALVTALALLFVNGVIRFNSPSRQTYPVRGVDVSSYQVEIDWPALAGQGQEPLLFAYLKATEGSTYVDSRFSYNWEQARKTHLKVGAYHFFSFDSDAHAQAEHIIATVPAEPDALPPAVDVEFYGDYFQHPPAAEQVQASLHEMLNALRAHYGKTPVLYATQQAYRLYLSRGFEEYPLWIRSVLGEPAISEREWQIWQYTDRQRLPGYRGEEKFIDMNAFSGSRDAFEEWAAGR